MLTRLPLTQRSVTMTTTVMILILMVSGGGASPLDYDTGPSVTDDFARWLVARLAQQRDIEVRTTW